MIVLEVVIRLLAFIAKEIVEVARRPAALASLVIGPFAIMLVFGLGYRGASPPLAAMIVVPEGANLSTELETYREFEREGISIEGVTRDVEVARKSLLDGEIEIVVVAPIDSADRFADGEQSVIGVEYAMIDPVRAAWASFVGRQLSAEVNREIIRRLVEEGQDVALVHAEDAAITRIPAETVAAPTRSEDRNLAPTTPGVVNFYGPAIVALILQHLALTLAALSLVRERTSGAIELYWISPVSATEVLLGKLLGFVVLVGLVAFATMVLLVGGLGIPMLADAWPIAGVISLLTIASIGIGLLLAAISDSERQAVQLTLLVLLASIFFSGLILPLSDFLPAVQALGNAIPVTHGMRLLQDLMLTGRVTAPWQVAALCGICVLTLFGAWLLLRHRMARI